MDRGLGQGYDLLVQRDAPRAGAVRHGLRHAGRGAAHGDQHRRLRLRQAEVRAGGKSRVQGDRRQRPTAADVDAGLTAMRAPGIAVVLLGFTLATTQAAAAPLDTAGATQCEARGWAKDKDPKGTNIRNAPRADAPVIGHLAPLTKIAADEWTGVEFDIVGSRN